MLLGLCLFVSAGIGLRWFQTPQPSGDTSSSVVAPPPDADPQYFPKGVFGDSAYPGQMKNFKAKSYSASLRAMHEPSLLEGSKDASLIAYRFLWLRSFHSPIAIRLTIRSDGTGSLVGKVTRGGGHSVEIPTDKVQRFQDLLQKTTFWTLPTEGPIGGLDGAEWILEGVRSGDYHVVERWSPKKDDYASLCLYLLQLSKIHVEAREVY